MICLFIFSTLTGRVAALSMIGQATEMKTVPYFWSAMFGKTIRYAGNVKMLVLSERLLVELDQLHHEPLIKLKYDRLSLIGTGYGDGFDDVIIQGDLDELRFVAFYTK